MDAVMTTRYWADACEYCKGYEDADHCTCGARNDYRALASWSRAPFGAAVMEARRALDEIDQLRADLETCRTAYQRDLQGLRDERDALIARRDEDEGGSGVVG